MYESPRAERLYPETEEVLNADFLLASNDQDENDNTVGITDLLK